VKFTSSLGRIDVEMRTSAGEATVVVRDTGMGIRREFLPHVFERFRQADSSHARRHGGLGLGLAIVRHLAEAHGGSVGVDSPGEGQGASFVVRLPARATHRVMPPADVMDPPRVARLAGLRILVVDDERDARDFLGALVALHGAEVEVAASVGEALDVMASWRPNILLADLGLPDRDGYALIEAVRALEPSLGSIPAVAVTAYAGMRERVRAFEAGYGWHVAKPVDPDQLLTVVCAAARTLQGDSNDTLQASRP
jgi:CheY-like chemotaxis protein